MGISVRPASMIQMKAPTWLWPGWIAEGKLHLLAGEAGTGKTTVAMNIAAIVSRGGCFPDNEPTAPGDVLIWSGEDDVSDTLVPRLYAAGADRERCKFINGARTATGGQRAFNPLTDVPLIEESLRDIETPPKLLIVDPIVSFAAGIGNQAVRSSLAPLRALAEKYGMAIIGITHVTKGSSRKSPKERVLGAQAFVAVARIVLMTSKRPCGDAVLVRIKSNIGPEDGDFSYRLESVDISHSGQTMQSSIVQWKDYLDESADDIMCGKNGAEPHLTPAVDEAVSFLVSRLSVGPCPQSDLFDEAFRLGHSIATLRRAKSILNIHSVRSDNRWWWEIPPTNPAVGHEGETSQGAQTNDEHLEPLLLLKGHSK